jgi:hypothetical protein
MLEIFTKMQKSEIGCFCQPNPFGMMIISPGCFLGKMVTNQSPRVISGITSNYDCRCKG